MSTEIQTQKPKIDEEPLENQLWFQIVMTIVLFFSIGLFIYFINSNYSPDPFEFIDNKISKYM